MKKIILFGSYVFGNYHDDSDIDIFVVIKDDSLLRELEASRIIRYALLYKIDKPIDLFVQKKSNFDFRSLGITFENEIKSTGRVIYG